MVTRGILVLQVDEAIALSHGHTDLPIVKFKGLRVFAALHLGSFIQFQHTHKLDTLVHQSIQLETQFAKWHPRVWMTVGCDNRC